MPKPRRKSQKGQAEQQDDAVEESKAQEEPAEHTNAVIDPVTVLESLQQKFDEQKNVAKDARRAHNGIDADGGGDDDGEEQEEHEEAENGQEEEEGKDDKGKKQRGRRSLTKNKRACWETDGVCYPIRCLANNAEEMAKHTKTQNAKLRCVVCCEKCVNHQQHSSRFGYRGRKSCERCGQMAQPLVSEHPDRLTLCVRARFNVLADEMPSKFGAYRDLSCWEIHHNGMPYPDLDCYRGPAKKLAAKLRKASGNAKQRSGSGQKSDGEVTGMKPKNNGVTVRDIRNKRSFWEKGGALYPCRCPSAMKVAGEKEKHVITRYNKIRCIVCCEKCNLEQKHEHRYGYRSRKSCARCGQLGQDKFTDHFPSLVLCTQSRFDKLADMFPEKYEMYRGRSCWDIHHEGMEYPTLKCYRTEPRVEPWPRKRQGVEDDELSSTPPKKPKITGQDQPRMVMESTFGSSSSSTGVPPPPLQPPPHPPGNMIAPPPPPGPVMVQQPQQQQLYFVNEPHDPHHDQTIEQQQQQHDGMSFQE